MMQIWSYYFLVDLWDAGLAYSAVLLRFTHGTQKGYLFTIQFVSVSENSDVSRQFMGCPGLSNQVQKDKFPYSYASKMGIVLHGIPGRSEGYTPPVKSSDITTKIDREILAATAITFSILNP